MPTRDANASNETSNELPCSFMYTQILKEILLAIEFEEQHIKDFIDYCRVMFADNTNELDKIKHLERNYRDKTLIWWYTYECFLYHMLNRALRTMDMDITIKIGFFVGDLHRHIQQLHFEQFGEHHFGQVFTVYRGQGLSKADFEQMINTKGGLISFNSFLSTSKDQKVSLGFAHRAVTNPDLVGIIFVMTIDSSQSSTPFASITDVSFFQKREEEVLFSMHTVFRIHGMKQMGGNNRLWQVELSLTSENDQDLQALTESMREKTEGSNEWFRLGRLLITMGQPDKAQQVYERMLKQTPDEIDKANIFHQLGWANYDQGKNGKALSFYKNSLEIRQKLLFRNDRDLANSYNCMSAVYYSMVDYSKALSSYEKALEIRQQILPPYHSDLAKSYNNIGNVYYSMDHYSKALSYYEKALEIDQKTLPSHHPDLAKSYNNIGAVYYGMIEYSKALSYYNKAFEIKRRSLPSYHPDLAASYNNIGRVHDNMGKYSEALFFYERAVDIEKSSLPANHPRLQNWQRNLDTVKKKL